VAHFEWPDMVITSTLKYFFGSRTSHPAGVTNA
jgi:hypothetical protein